MKKTTAGFLMLLIVVVMAELVSFLSLEYILSPLGASYVPSPMNEKQFRQYMKERHPVLGWPKLAEFQKNNGINSRRSLVNSGFKKSCVSLYGDSFTFGDGVYDQYSWAEVAASQLRCKIRNFGVGGYGSDQAYLRFVLQKDRDPSKIVVLNHLSENILRNVNQFRSLLYPGRADNFKPVFKLNRDGVLTLIELPSFSSYRQYLTTVENPAARLKYDAFLPGGRNRGSRIAFPYIGSLGSVLGNDFHIRARLKSVPRHLNFYTVGHPSNGLGVTSEILKRFHAEAQSLNKTPVVTIIPLCDDFRYFRKYRRWTYQPLIEELKKAEVNVLNFGAEIIQVIGVGNTDAMYDDCSGHPNKKGYRIMGTVFARFLKTKIGKLGQI